MKRILIIVVLLYMQVTIANATEVVHNTQCSAAERLCSIQNTVSVKTQNFDFTGTTSCLSNTTRLYYIFRSSVSGSHTMLTYTTGSNNSTFKLFGPFISSGNACNQIEQLTASPLASSGTSATSQSIIAVVSPGQFYILEVSIASCNGTITINTPQRLTNCSNDINCEDCIGSFQPTQGEYILSAWVKEANSSNSITTYSNSQIGVDAGSGFIWFAPSGQIIDGWQRIEGVFSANSVGAISVQLKALSFNVYFDDIRIFPFDGSMMSYVYDPLTLRLVAELDERNYAKFYEYDEEGKLIRVKKETEKGIMTIQENRDNSSGL